MAEEPCKWCDPEGGEPLLKQELCLPWVDDDWKTRYVDSDVEIWMDDLSGQWKIEADGGVSFSIPINNCPKCGRRLVKE